MGKFGWSLPPGCGILPGEEEYPCDVCGGMPEKDCICPGCPVCGSYGNPDCYVGSGAIDHGLKKTQEQIDQLAAKEEEWAEQDQIEDIYLSENDPDFFSDEDILC